MKLYLIAILSFILSIPAYSQVEEDEAPDELGRAAIAMRKRQFIEAETLYRVLVSKNPDDVSLEQLLIHSLISQKKYIESDSMLNKLIAKDSNNMGNYWYKGLMAEHQLLDSDAVYWFKYYILKSKNSHGQNPSAWLHVGSGYRRMMHSKGITAREVDELIYYYESYLRKANTDAYADDMRIFIEELRSRKPAGGTKLVWDEIE